ncbi:MAG: hypothetical protein Kow0027_15190 [Saprospiraceae bacterium]
MNKLFFFAVAILLLGSCAPKEYSAIILPEPEHRNLDTLVVTAPKPDPDTIPEIAEEDYTLPVYNPSARRENDLLHTKLELSFDWEKEEVLGKATLTLKPYFYATDKVVLDAKGFEFHEVKLVDNGKDLKYDYDGSQITIHLDRSYDRNEKYKLFIDYTARPSETGGSAAITSDKGLFFINPRGEDPGKPRQIWTQGETENNSRWFPTIDKPNERCTQEMYLTVDDNFVTLSNGRLISSKKNPDGTRTDYWHMDLPHAPYLFMVAIGEYAVVHDEWKGKPVDYYVEPEYEPYARRIFPYTPEMLTFFSDILNYPYPWQKYSQVVVRDYVSGAMENTTAVIFGEFMQGTDRELVDNLQNEKVVAHEMFHHWFGDLVTCESWANLTLNEGFANYSEYLWLEHKYGKDEADFHRIQELQGYLQSAEQGIHPLMHFAYDDKEDMFDAHSYNKGGLVLHMLRNYVGDEAFFASLNKYLVDNEFSDVEGHELRLAFEDVTGEDLNWFFNQWFYSEGHPELKVDYDYDDETGEVIVQVAQTQNAEEMPPIFILPVDVDVYVNGEVQRHRILINQRKQEFRLPAPADPELIVFDGDGMLLAKIDEAKSEEEYISQLKLAPNILHRLKAMQELRESDSPEVQALFKQTLNDDFWLLRLFATNLVELDDETEPQLLKMATDDPHSAVRETVLGKLAESGDSTYVDVIKSAINNDPALSVVSAALKALLELDKEEALSVAEKLESEKSESIILALAGLYADAGRTDKLPFFEENLNKVGGFSQFGFIEDYTNLAAQASPDQMIEVATQLKDIAMNDGKLFWMRYVATKSINDLHAALAEQKEAAATEEEKMKIATADEQLISIIEVVKAWEKDERVQRMYAGFPDPPLKP